MRKLFLALLLIAPFHAHSVPLTTVADGTYEISSTNCRFDDAACSSLLMSMAWWGDEALAFELATLLGTSLGLPNFRDEVSPYFAYTIGTDFVDTWGWCDGPTLGCVPAKDFEVGVGLTHVDDVYWAVGVRVPEPGTLALLGAGLLGLAFRRKKAA